MKLDTKLFDLPRWPGGPPICNYENLLAFSTRKDLDDWRETNCPSVGVGEIWQCGRCNHWHFTSTGVPPSGASSGTSRKMTLPIPRYKRGKPAVNTG